MQIKNTLWYYFFPNTLAVERDQFYVIEMSAKCDTLYRKFVNLYQSYNFSASFTGDISVPETDKSPCPCGLLFFWREKDNNKHNHSILECDVLCKKRRDPGTVDWEWQDISHNLIGPFG